MASKRIKYPKRPGINLTTEEKDWQSENHKTPLKEIEGDTNKRKDKQLKE